MWPNFRELTMHSNALSVNNSLAICRLCMLNTGSMMEPIFRPSTAGCVAVKITNVTRLTLCQGDGLPALVCQQCIFLLDVTDRFIQQCIISDKSLRSILLQGQNQFSSKENTGDFINQLMEPLATKGPPVENQEDESALDEDAGILQLEISNGTPNFKAVDPLALPQHLILNNGNMEEDAERIIGLPNFAISGANLGRHLSSSDPLSFVKHENTLETVSSTENDEGKGAVKIEDPDCELSLEHSADELFYKDSDSEVNMTAEGFNCLVMHADYEQACMQNSCKSAVSNEAGKECETSPPSNQMRFQQSAKKQTCPVCFIRLASRSSLTRHLKIHKRNEKSEQRRMARKNSVSHSKIGSPLQDKLENGAKDLDTLHGTISTRSSRAEPPKDTGILPDACLNTDQLNMTPIVRVAKLVITKDTIQNIVSLFKQSNSKQDQTYSASQKLKTHGNLSCNTRKSTANRPNFVGGTLHQKVNSSFATQSKQAAEIEIQWDYHRKIPSNDESHTKICLVCNLVCRDYWQLGIHMRSHTGERPFKCVHCNKRYQVLQSLKRHMKEHTEDREFKCRKCLSSFHTTHQLQCHETMHTVNRGPRKCSDCGKTFASNWSLKAHSFIHSNVRPWKCRQCDSSFKRFHDFLKHQRLRHNLKCKRKSCRPSSKEFQKNNEIHKTNILHAPKSRTCKLQERIRNSHVQQNSRTQVQKSLLQCKTVFGPFKCETCGKQFSKIRNLKRHSLSHSTEKLWKCGICSLSYKYRSNLKKHERQCHPKQKYSAIELSVKPNVAKCPPILQQNFSADAVPVALGAKEVSPLLAGHAKKRKGSMKIQYLSPHKCTTCGKAFSTFSILKQHSSTHSAERPWKCDQCDFAYKRRDSLVRHVKLRKHESSTNAVVLQPAIRPQKVAAIGGKKISENLIHSEVHEDSEVINPENSTYELTATELSTQIRSEILTKDNLGKSPEIHNEIYESSGPSPLQEVLENLDDLRSEERETIITDCLAQICTNNWAKDHLLVKNIKIDSEIDKNSHHYRSPPQIVTENLDDFSADEFKTINTECFFQNCANISANDHLAKHTEIYNEMDASSLKDQSPLHEITETVGNTISEAIQDISEKTDFIKTESYESLTGCFMSDILNKDHDMNEEIDKSYNSELLVQQKGTSTTPAISVMIDSQILDSIVMEHSIDISNSCNEQQLRVMPKQLLERNFSVKKTEIFVNELSDPTSQQQSIGDNYNSCIASVSKSSPERHPSPLNCKLCDKTCRHLHELKKHMSCHSRKHIFHCSHCDAMFYRKCHLRDHIDSHSAIVGQKCQTCLIEFKSEFDLKVHAMSHCEKPVSDLANKSPNSYCNGDKEISSTVAPQSEAITSQRSSKKEIGTSGHKDVDAPQANVSFNTLACPTELQYVHDKESREIRINHETENIDPPSFLRHILESSPRPLLNEQHSQVVATNMGTLGTPLESKRIFLDTEIIAESHRNIAKYHKNIPQKQDTNLSAHNKNCNTETSMRMTKSEGGQSQSSIEMSNEQTASLQMEYIPKIPQNGSFIHVTNIIDSEAKVSVGEKTNHSSKVRLKHSSALKNKVAVPLLIDNNINKVLRKNNASPKTCSSENAELRVPEFIFTFLGTEFDCQQSSVQSKPSSVKKQDFYCKPSGKSFARKKSLGKRRENFHGDSGKSFECQGCHKSFNVTGSLGCNCLALL